MSKFKSLQSNLNKLAIILIAILHVSNAQIRLFDNRKLNFIQIIYNYIENKVYYYNIVLTLMIKMY